MRPTASLTAIAFMLIAGVAYGDADTRAALAKRQPSIDLRDVALTDAIDFIRDSTRANVVVDWAALEQIGVSKDTPITLKLRNVPLRAVLKSLLESASPGLLTYYVDGNVLNITTLALADEKQITVLYPVQDLLVEIPDFVGPKISLTDSGGGGGGKSGGGGGSSGGGLFGGGNSGNDTNDDKGRTRAHRAQDLIDLIQSTIRPDVWDTAGGKARIRFFNGNLVVTAPRSVQEAIGGPID